MQDHSTSLTRQAMRSTAGTPAYERLKRQARKEEGMQPPTTVNHFPVIAGKPTGEREFLVVCDRGPMVYDEYVTWRVYIRPEDNSVVAYSGFYTDTLDSAIHNMEER